MPAKKVKKRLSKIKRKTKETRISLELNIDGTGIVAVATGVPFFDHMLTLMAAHGFFDLSIEAHGDVDVDGHHTVEDVGIVLGQAMDDALGDKKGIKRYGHSVVPMDEALAYVTIDFSNRPYLSYNATFSQDRTGNFDVELAEEFFRAFVSTSRSTLHVNLVYGENTHHKIEAIFKAFGRALDEATKRDPRIADVLSTKGVL
jgi:imidazoleglycerol-phosphate dehydratase